MGGPVLRILDTSFNLLGEIDNYESLQFTRRFYRAGEFEMHITLDKQNTDKLFKDNVVMIANQPHKTGIILHREIVTTDNGIESVMVKGSTLGGILDRRITVTDDYDRVRGKAETVLKHYINQHIVNGIYPERKIPFFICAPDLLRGKETPWQSRFEPLHEVIEEIAKWCDIGWLVKLDVATQKWVFDVITGRDLTVDQNVLPPVVFSHEFDNIQSQQYVDSDLNYKNVGYAGGPGDEYERLIQMVGAASGLDRREVFLDCSSAEDVLELIDMGDQQLAEQKRIETLEGKILNTHSFQYEKDWDLGDIVTVMNKKWGLMTNTRITEVKEVFEPASKLEVVFGEELPTITKIVKHLQTKAKRRG